MDEQHGSVIVERVADVAHDVIAEPGQCRGWLDGAALYGKGASCLDIAGDQPQ